MNVRSVYYLGDLRVDAKHREQLNAHPTVPQPEGSGEEAGGAQR
jgi:hypothetical protein